MFCKKRIHFLNASYEFNKIFQFVENYCEDMPRNEQIDLIDFVMRLLRNDMQTDYVADILYNQNKETIYPNLFPFYLHKQNGKSAVADSLVEIELSQVCVISSFWRTSSFKAAIRNIKKQGLISSKHRPTGQYFEDMNIGCIDCGYHHGGVAAVMGTGTVFFSSVQTSVFFPCIETDGEWWIISSTKEKKWKVQDFRAAALYELARIKYNLTTQTAAD